MRCLVTAFFSLVVYLVLCVSCAGVGSETEQLFTPTGGGVEATPPSQAVPGYYSGVVPWELDDPQVVNVAVQAQQELAPGDGKMTQSVFTVPFVTPDALSDSSRKSELVDALDFYYGENAEPSEVHGLQLDPREGTAFACYELAMPAECITIGLAWYSLPTEMDAYYIGIGDRAEQRWRWFLGPDDGVLTSALNIDPTGSLLVAVVLDGGYPAELWQLKAGAGEVRGTGLIYEEPVAGHEASRVSSKTVSSFPAVADLKVFAPAMHNQGSMGSCTAFGVNDAAHNIMLNQLYSAEGWDVSLDENLASPMWSYVNSGIPPIGSWDPPCGSNVGRYMSQAFNVLEQIGTATEATVPYYATENCATEFSATASDEAALLQIDDWYYISGSGASIVEQIKAHLADWQMPVVIAMYGLETGFLYYSGGVYHYGGTPGVNGGHAMCIVGYDDDLQAFEVRNSWGSSWGLGGYWWCGYDAVEDLVNEGGRFSAYSMDVSYNPSAASYFLGTGPDYDEEEPNDTLATANPLPNFDFEAYTGAIGQGDDTADFLSFDYSTGTATEFELVFNEGLVVLELELYNQQGSLLATGTGSAGSRSLSGVWSANGTAVLKVVHESGSGTYTLSGEENQPLAPPDNVAATDGTAEAVTITWSVSPNAQYYEVRRAISMDGAYEVLTTTYSTEYVDSNAELWQQYWYAVVAANQEGSSVPSTADSGYRALPAVSAISASDSTYEDRVAVSWEELPGPEAYLLMRSISANGPFQTVGTYSSSPVDDLSASPGLVYYYVVHGVSGELVGPPCAPDAGARAGEPQLDVTDNEQSDDEIAEERQPPIQEDSGDEAGREAPTPPPLKVN